MVGSLGPCGQTWHFCASFELRHLEKLKSIMSLMSTRHYNKHIWTIYGLCCSSIHETFNMTVFSEPAGWKLVLKKNWTF